MCGSFYLVNPLIDESNHPESKRSIALSTFCYSLHAVPCTEEGARHSPQRRSWRAGISFARPFFIRRRRRRRRRRHREMKLGLTSQLLPNPCFLEMKYIYDEGI